MGNATSGEISEPDPLSFQNLAQPDDSRTPGDNPLDLSALFNSDALLKALVNVKDVPGTSIQKNTEAITKWLKAKLDKDETTVNLAQFVDFLTGKEVSKEEAMEFFTDVDCEEEGVVDITYLLSVLQDADVSDPINALQPCHILPGPVDVYADEKGAGVDLWKKLVKFLQNRRVQSSRLTHPAQSHTVCMFHNRDKLVNGRYNAYLEKEKDVELVSLEGIDEEEMEKTVISHCYSKITVSSNEKNVSGLTDGRGDTYWQSNGAPRKHWIRLHVLPGVIVKELSIAVDTSDDSYMPKELAVLVGNSESGLRELRTVTVPRELTGKLVLIRNLRKDYRYVQVNIRACHSDGCDTRVRGIAVKGCKFSKEAEPSVLDTMATWYLSLVAATAKAAMPVAPGLRDTILVQSKQALGSLSPLVLSPTSSAKPEFLSPFVVKEMDRFLTQLCLPGDNFVSVDRDSLQVLLSFALAHGNVNSILTCLQILLDNLSLELPVATVLKLDEIQLDKEYKHAEGVKLAVVLCDGGEKDDTHKAENVLSNELGPSGNPYVSATGKAVVNFLLKQKEDLFVKLIRVTIKVQSGSQGAKMGLVFCAEGSKGMTHEALLKEYDQYNGWTADDYNKLKKERAQGKEVDPCSPIAYFEPEKESGEVSFTVDVIKPGSYILIKFLGTVGADAERMGIHCIKMHGYSLSPEDISRVAFVHRLNTLAILPSDKNTLVPGVVVLMRVLSFITLLLHDLASLQSSRRSISLDPAMLGEAHLASDHLSLEKIWSLYIPLAIHSSEALQFCSILCLHLLRASLPFIRPSREKKIVGSDVMTTPTTVLVHLCGLLDSEDTDPVVRKLAQDIVVEGVVVFFPDAKTRREYLLSMINTILDGKQSNSWWLKFEALCVYFSQSDGHTLLELPKTIPKDKELNTDATMSIFTTMIQVAQKEALGLIEGGAPRPDNLVKLLSALQSSLFFWCRQHLTGGEEGIRKQAAHLLEQYVSKLSSSCAEILKALGAVPQKSDALLHAIAKTTIGCVLPHMTVLLSCMANLPVDRMNFLSSLKCLVKPLHELASQLPAHFLDVDSPVLGSAVQEEAVVGIWTRESAHNYENNAHVTEEFVSPTAVKFIVEFDPRCRTEKRYDYLEFTDSLGHKTTFDDTYGSERWPKTATFAGPKVQFYFHSDGSTNEWGYKFTLKAYGRTIPPLYWLNDLQLSLAQLLGKLCSVTLSTKSLRMPLSDKKEDKEAEALLHSNLWRTLFRGGYQENKDNKFARTISGVYTTSSDSSLSTLLHDLANGVESAKVVSLLDICQAEKKRQTYGGQLVDRAVNAVFAAFICHTQELREEMIPFVYDEGTLVATPKLMSAYVASEAMRRDLVEARQKLMEAKEKEEDPVKKAKIDEDAPVKSCLKKAQYLLKFAGLSKTQKEDRVSSPLVRPAWATKGKQWQKVSTAVNTVGKLKQQLQGSDKENLTEKYPSFELVLNFVKNDAISEEQVHFLLQQRAQFARCTNFVYSYATEYLRAIGTPAVFELTGLIFLQYLLSEQRHFPLHYASKMDGCGLELENSVRRSYHGLLAAILDAITVYAKPKPSDHKTSQILVSSYLLHLLDCQWQDYDFTLISDLQLPEFLIRSAVMSSSLEKGTRLEKFDKEEDMMKLYELHMAFLEKWKAASSPSAAAEAIGDTKESRLFLICKRAFAPEPETSGITCASCSTSDTPEWYHDIDCNENLNLCKTCFFGSGDNQSRSHSSEHLFQAIDRRFRCAGCGLCIVSHRFKSQSRTEYHLCLGCFRKEESQGHADSWLVYPLTEQPEKGQANRYLSTDPGCSAVFAYKDGFKQKLESKNDLSVYNTRHAWTLFSSVCLFVASSINNTQTGAHSRATGALLVQCVQLLGYLLRAALLGRLEDDKKVKVLLPTDQKKAGAVIEGTSPLVVGINEVKVAETAVSQPTTTPSETAVSQPTTTPSETAVSQPTTTPSETAVSQPTTTPSETAVSQPTTTPGEAAVSQPTTTPGEAAVSQPTTTPSEAQPSVGGSEATPTAGAAETPATAVAPTPALSLSFISSDELSRIGQAEKTFGALYLEQMFGLLAAILPDSPLLQPWIQSGIGIEELLAETLLPTLIAISNAHCFSEAQNQLALLLATRYMSKVTPEVGDRAVVSVRGCSTEGKKTGGMGTAQYLLEKGNSHLKGGQCSNAMATARCFSLLSRVCGWKPAINSCIDYCLQSLLEETKPFQIFGFLAAAGFPRVLREGATVCKHVSDEGNKKAVVTAVKSESDEVVIVDLSTREPSTVKLTAVEIEDSVPGCIDKSRLDTLLCILMTSLQLTKQETEISIEHTWVLGLALKALNYILSAPDSEDVVNSVVAEGLLPSIVKLAGKPTNLSTKWHLSDLEVLGIQTYEHVSSTPEPVPGKPEKAEVTTEPKDTPEVAATPNGPDVKPEGEEDEPEVKSKLPPPPKEGSQKPEVPKKSLAEREEDKALEGVPRDVHDMLKIMGEAFQCKLSILRALYEAAGRDVQQLVQNTDQYYNTELSEIRPPEEVVEAAKKWDINFASVQEAVLDIPALQEDAGIFQVMPIPVDLRSVEAAPEDISTSATKAEIMGGGGEGTTKAESEDHSAEESYRLLKKELADLKQKPDRKQILKIHQGVVVMWARSVVGSILGRWPASCKLSLVHLGCSSTTEYFSLLDLLLRGHDAEQCKQTLHSIVHNGELTEVLQLASAASQCMREVSVGMETKDIRQPLADKNSEGGKIMIPGACKMRISFDQSCTLAGTVVVSSSEDLSESKSSQSSSGTGPQKWNEHVVPGNTLYYKVTLDDEAKSSVKFSRFYFSVVGIQTGRFDTGYSILRTLLCEEEAICNQICSQLPLSGLWSNLISVACQVTGKERLKILGLLMRLVRLCQSPASQAAAAAVASSHERLNLSALKPLWQLYTKLIKDYEGSGKTGHILAPEIIRAMSELFFVVESLAEEWGITQDLLIETLTKEGLSMWLEKGISNVALISVALGLDNMASKAFVDAKISYVPPVPKTEGKDEGGGEDEGDDDDDDDDEGDGDSDDDDDDDQNSDDS